MAEAGLRERKKARQKIAIMEAMVDSLARDELTDIRVAPLCRTLGISKVTFFNYFSSKEQVVEYFVRTWQLRIGLELRSRGITGRDALVTIFDSIGRHPAGQHIMNAVALHMLKVEEYVPVAITDYEQRIVTQLDHVPADLPSSADALFREALAPVIADGDERERMVRQLMAGLYGVPVRIRVSGSADLAAAYREFLAVVMPRR